MPGRTSSWLGLKEQYLIFATIPSTESPISKYFLTFCARSRGVREVSRDSNWGFHYIEWTLLSDVTKGGHKIIENDAICCGLHSPEPAGLRCMTDCDGKLPHHLADSLDILLQI